MKTLAAISAAIALSFFPVYAPATLGQPIDSAAKNLSAPRAATKISTDKYTVHEYEKNGNTVREYASTSGVVFAVGWNGISKPDLNALFGSYFTEYSEALLTVPKNYGAKTVSMKTAQMVVRRGGRMRDQRGFVYVPSLVPEGVAVEDLQ